MTSIKKTISVLIISTLTINCSFAQWKEDANGIYPTSLDKAVGIGTSNPSCKLEIKGSVAMLLQGSYLNAYHIGWSSDFGSGEEADYLLLSPIVQNASPSEAAGLSGTLRFYRGNTGTYNANHEYKIAFQSAYTDNLFNISSQTAYSSILKLYQVTHGGKKYVAIYCPDVMVAGSTVTFAGFWWNDINNTKPTLVKARSVSEISILKSYNNIYGNEIVIDSSSNVGIGTVNPITKLDVRGNVYINSGIDDNHIYWEGHNMTLGTPVGSYSHNTLKLKPGGSSSGSLYTGFEMYTANSPTSFEKKVQIASDNGYTFFNGGNVGIGTTTPTEKLSVNGNIKAKKLIITQTGWADYVFDKAYRLMPVDSLSTYIKTHKHLPEIPTTKDVQDHGVDVGNNQALLLKKIEELTLYIIEQHKEIEALKKKIK